MQRLRDVWNDTEGPVGRVKSWVEPLRKAAPGKISAIFLFFVVFSAAGFLTARFFNNFVPSESLVELDTASTIHKHHHNIPKIPRKIVNFPLNCTLPVNQTILTCPTNYPTTFQPEEDEDTPTCPDYFRWIHKDLETWKVTGITLDVLLSGKLKADFRLTVINGKAYLETYGRSFQSRDLFSLWGILQLLRKYPGKVPDFDIMFKCGDMPMVPIRDYAGSNVTAPPVMHYCSDPFSLDIVFPDWSFWGWAELSIKPWESLSIDLIEANNKTKWSEREPHAFWKGNPDTSGYRQDLMRCNVSTEHDWGARVYRQNWGKEVAEGFKDSNLAKQCIHRYKIFVEGRAWSASDKYIMACNSLTLIIKEHFYDFYSRNLIPLKHYWPIKDNDECRSIEAAIDWGERNKKQAQMLGKAGTEFILEDVKMDYVYDYMFHLLNEYAKLLKFKPTIPPGAVELCSETMACNAWPQGKEYMVDSMVKAPSNTKPCTMPAPYDSKAIESLRKKKEKGERKVEKLQKTYWDKHSEKQH